MSCRYIKYVLLQNVLTISMNRPESRNAFIPEMLDEILSVITSADAGAKAVVLTGEGLFFSVGTRPLLEGTEYSGPSEDFDVVEEGVANPLIACLADLSIPVVCAVNGPAVGAAVGLALAGDLVVMGRRSYLQLAPVHMGQVPDAASICALTRSLGRARAMRMALFGDRIGAAQAIEAGLVGYVVPDGFVRSEAQALAQRLAEGPTLAIASTRRQINCAVDHGLDEILELEGGHASWRGLSFGFSAEARKLGNTRPPRFVGR